ncbi:MAG: hypothetical protein ACYDGY_02815 [Acidimicrobiales bacterium]
MSRGGGIQTRRKSSTKLALILAGLLIASISILGLGAFALFTATASNNSTASTNDATGNTPGPQKINTADLVLALQNTADGTNGGGGSVSVNLTDPPIDPVVPGDTIERAVNLVNGDSTGANLASIALGYSDATSGDLLTEDSTGCPSGDTNCTSGNDELTFWLQACSVAWTASTAQPPTFTCSGTQSTVLGGTTAGTDAISAVLGSTPSLGSVAALTAGSTSYLMVELTLPTTAGNTVQSLTSAGITYTFTGAQSAGTNV